MYKQEQQLRKAGFELIAGVDEAGRGPLAGPVVSAAVIFPSHYQHADINDSKQLSAIDRERLFVEITHNALSYAVVMMSAQKIDAMGILVATKLAMRQAVLKLNPLPDFVLTDAVALNLMDLPQKAIVKGDATVFSIAAASILAKVTRDRWMMKQHENFPEYGFNEHMGYGTKMHLEAIEKHGPCKIHRLSFRPLKTQLD